MRKHSRQRPATSADRRKTSKDWGGAWGRRWGQRRKKIPPPPRKAHLYGPAKVRLDPWRASLREKSVGGWRVEAVVGSSVPKGTEVTILAGTRTSGDNRREEKRERQRWEKAGEAGTLWHPMSRSPLELDPGITHSNQAGGQLFHNTDTQPADSSALVG